MQNETHTTHKIVLTEEEVKDLAEGREVILILKHSTVTLIKKSAEDLTETA